MADSVLDGDLRFPQQRRDGIARVAVKVLIGRDQLELKVRVACLLKQPVGLGDVACDRGADLDTTSRPNPNGSVVSSASCMMRMWSSALVPCPPGAILLNCSC